MKKIPFGLFALLIMALALPQASAFALPLAEVGNNQVTLDFPNTATFSAELSAAAEITSVTLEYGDRQITCGSVIAKAYPQFTPGKRTQVSWTWDMRQSGSLPPGAQLWWRWRYGDASGAEYVSEEQTAIWLDSVHNWQTASEGMLSVHWYGKNQDFAKTMLAAGLEGLRRNEEQAGLKPTETVHIYIYPSYAEMQDAILYEPSWTGGMAFSEHNIFIMGVSSADMEWNKKTIVHELTHILIGRFTFSCIGVVPTWLNEGLAMYAEGELDAPSQAQLDRAIQSDALISLRSLNGAFSELSDKANLSYSQSQSVVKFLIESYGRQKMTELLTALRDAKPIDDALREIYGFDTDGLEDAWRAAVKAAPRSVSAQPTAQPTPTFVPTYVPVTGGSLAATPTPYAVPTSSFDGSQNETGGAPSSPWSDSNFIFLTVAMVCVCGFILLVLGIFALGFILRKGNAKNKGGGHA